MLCYVGGNCAIMNLPKRLTLRLLSRCISQSFLILLSDRSKCNGAMLCYVGGNCAIMNHVPKRLTFRLLSKCISPSCVILLSDRSRCRSAVFPTKLSILCKDSVQRISYTFNSEMFVRTQEMFMRIQHWQTGCLTT